MRPNVRGRVRHALPIVFGLTAFGPGSSQNAFAQTIPTYGTNCVDVELAAPTSSGPPAVGGTARFYLVTSEGGQGTPYNTLSECLQARAKATQTAICINR